MTARLRDHETETWKDLNIRHEHRNSWIQDKIFDIVKYLTEIWKYLIISQIHGNFRASEGNLDILVFET